MKKPIYQPLAYALLLLVLVCSSFLTGSQKPVLYEIGDSTVKNGKGRGDSGLWGWGDYLHNYLDTARISVENDALGGTSTRTFQTKGLWNAVLAKLKKGDYVIMQFGHNDSGPLDDTARARGTIKGTGTEEKEIYNPITKQQEVVHTYGWYLRKFIQDAKAKGAIAIVCSPIPRNMWQNGKIVRNTEDYGKWAKEVAQQEGAFYIDLNAIIADRYDQQGEDKVTQTYFTKIDHTHTSLAGAELNAAAVAQGISQLKHCRLSRYLVENSSK